MYVYYNDINNNVINRTNGVDRKNENSNKNERDVYAFTTRSRGRAAPTGVAFRCRRSSVSSVGTRAVIKTYITAVTLAKTES